MTPITQKEHEDLKMQLAIERASRAEREISEKTYARKIFENAVIWVAVIICGGVLVALVNIVIHRSPSTIIQSQ